VALGERYRQHVAAGQFVAATSVLRATTQRLYIWHLEGWGERDNSLSRVGTRFEHLARLHGRDDLILRYRELTALSDDQVSRRMVQAPRWVHDRHRCSFAARQAVGETTTELEDARDVLRVCSMYELPNPQVNPPPAWLAITTEPGAVQSEMALLADTLDSWFE
jgi:hypothetical protein